MAPGWCGASGGYRGFGSLPITGLCCSVDSFRLKTLADESLIEELDQIRVPDRVDETVQVAAPGGLHAAKLDCLRGQPYGASLRGCELDVSTAFGKSRFF